MSGQTSNGLFGNFVPKHAAAATAAVMLFLSISAAPALGAAEAPAKAAAERPATKTQAAPAKNAQTEQKTGPSVPEPIRRAAQRWKVDVDDMVIAVMPLERVRIDANGRSNASQIKLRYGLNANRTDRPASTAKLITTLVGLEELTPAFHWFTGFYTEEWPVLEGEAVQNPQNDRISNLYIRGGGDPSLVIEDFALQVDRLAQMGVKHIDGNIVIDRSYFKIPPVDSGAFDGRSSRPYNLPPDAALMNFRNLSFEIIPEKNSDVARVVTLPAEMSGVVFPKTVKITKGGCGDWKSKLGFKLLTDENGTKRAVFQGSLPRACGSKNFNVIAFEPNDYFERVFRALWEKDGRTWNGHVVDGQIPHTAEQRFVRMSPGLAETAQLINKWSNNTMARHLFLTLGQVKVLKEEADAKKATQTEAKDEAESSGWKQFSRPVTLEDARGVVADWLKKRGIDSGKVYLENGSGLSRETRVTGRTMVEILAAGWQGPVMPEYLASLPITGEDGTMVKRKIAKGYGRIKTGFLNDVRSIGGYVLTKSGERYAVYASIHGSKNMPGATAVLDNVIDWVYKLPPQK